MGKVILGLAAPHNPNITSRPDKMSPERPGQARLCFRSLEKKSCRKLLPTAC